MQTSRDFLSTPITPWMESKSFEDPSVGMIAFPCSNSDMSVEKAQLLPKQSRNGRKTRALSPWNEPVSKARGKLAPRMPHRSKSVINLWDDIHNDQVKEQQHKVKQQEAEEEERNRAVKVLQRFVRKCNQRRLQLMQLRQAFLMTRLVYIEKRKQKDLDDIAEKIQTRKLEALQEIQEEMSQCTLVEQESPSSGEQQGQAPQELKKFIEELKRELKFFKKEKFFLQKRTSDLKKQN